MARIEIIRNFMQLIFVFLTRRCGKALHKNTAFFRSVWVERISCRHSMKKIIGYLHDYRRGIDARVFFCSALFTAAAFCELPLKYLNGYIYSWNTAGGSWPAGTASSCSPSLYLMACRPYCIEKSWFAKSGFVSAADCSTPLCLENVLRCRLSHFDRPLSGCILNR